MGVRVMDYIYQNHAQNIVVPGGTKFNNDHESTKDRLERFSRYI